MADLVVVLGLAVAACAATGLLGALALRLLRRSSLRYQLLTATLLPVVAVALAVVVAVVGMFLSGHDSGVVLTTLAIAVTLAALGAWLVTRTLLTGFRRISLAVADLSASVDHPPPVLVREEPDPPSSALHRPASAVAEVPAEMAAVLTDVDTARRRLVEARARERAAEEARRELVSFMSHDLRTPLAGMRAVLEGIEDDIVADVPAALTHLRTTVARMSLLVDDLFALSRVQGSASSERRQAVALAEVVDDVLLETSALAAAAGVDLRGEVLPGDRLTVLGNHTDLTRAVTNLISNAIRHTAPGLAVLVRTGRTPGGAIRVEVVDQCGGIPEPHLARVFDTGWRGSAARDGQDGGAGLGLAIVRGVAQSHDGNIGVHNTRTGCSFALELPSPAPNPPPGPAPR